MSIALFLSFNRVLFDLSLSTTNSAMPPTRYDSPFPLDMGRRVNEQVEVILPERVEEIGNDGDWHQVT